MKKANYILTLFAMIFILYSPIVSVANTKDSINVYKETVEEKKREILGTTRIILGDTYTAKLTNNGILYWANENEPNALIINAIDEMNIDPRISDYNKCIFINDYLREKLHYDNNAVTNGITANYNPWMIYCLSDGNAVCAGYTETFQKLCLANGIECWYDVGYVVYPNEQYHAWNKVIIDGKSYYVDVTFNDQDNYRLINRYLMSETLFDDRYIEKEVKTFSINSDRYPIYDGTFIIRQRNKDNANN